MRFRSLAGPRLVQTHLEVLKSKDVQDADGLEVVSAPDAIVDFADDPVEALRVKCHGHGVPGVHRLQRNRRGTALRTYQIWRLKLSLKAKIKRFVVGLVSGMFHYDGVLGFSWQTCSTVSGVEISSPLRIMERWVRTSASWSEFSPRSSDSRLRAADERRDLRWKSAKTRLLSGPRRGRLHRRYWFSLIPAGANTAGGSSTKL